MLLSIIFTIAFSEIAYRLYLMQKRSVAKDSEFMQDALNYSAVDDVLTEFNLEFGYSYVANRSNNRVLVHNGYPVMCTQATINGLGNTNRVEGNYEDATVKILVFGDSFTANTDLNGITWPDLLQDELEAKFNQDINVVNFGRGAYGVLQMFDLARPKIEELEPDLVIFAFISSDLVRARFWRTATLIDGEERDFVMAEPSEQANLEESIDATVVNSMITREWCEDMLVTLDRDDALINALNEEFIQRRREYADPVEFNSLSTSFLFNRIVHNDPFRGFMGPSLIPRLSESSYAADSRFIGNVNHINESNIPYVLIHLPTYEDLKAGEYELSEQEQSLFESFQEVTGKQIINFIEYASSHDSNNLEDLEKLFLSPYDRHPSLQGIRFYAEVVSEILITLQKE
ncbi:MAG TPA: SGNH/GDSL hydrolase family protein [Candidatus Bathyarchaeia archaeon]|nr:SGNH/GDSL hydrolase family protein [Candidatus Bathyarchaeia archaeon]